MTGGVLCLAGVCVLCRVDVDLGSGVSSRHGFGPVGIVGL